MAIAVQAANRSTNASIKSTTVRPDLFRLPTFSLPWLFPPYISYISLMDGKFLYASGGNDNMILKYAVDEGRGLVLVDSLVLLLTYKIVSIIRKIQIDSQVGRA